MNKMKVIDLGNRVIFVNDIIYIYNEYKCGEYTNYYCYYIVTKHEKIPVSEHYYKIVKEYLLSLNEDTKDDTFEHLFNSLSGRCKKLIDYVDDLKDSKSISVTVAKRIKDILQSGF